MIIVNPPWQFDLQLEALLPILHRHLSLGGGSWRVQWLARD